MMLRSSLIALAVCASLAGQLKLPSYSRQVLPNGVVVDLQPRSGVPLVGFRILVKGGVEAEPANLAGLAGVTAQLLRKGAGKRSADQFSEELDFLGGTFQTGDSPQSSVTTISGEFLKKDFDRGLDLIADAVLHPKPSPGPEVLKPGKPLSSLPLGVPYSADAAQPSRGGFVRRSQIDTPALRQDASGGAGRRKRLGSPTFPKIGDRSRNSRPI